MNITEILVALSQYEIVIDRNSYGNISAIYLKKIFR